MCKVKFVTARDVDNDLGYQFDQQRFNDMGFLQTTVYTVIGTFLVIKITVPNNNY